jgi:CRP-like cAMP-binding protein
MISPSGNSRLTENQILAALNKKDYQDLFSQLEHFTLHQGTIVYEADSPINYVYFPQTAVFSMLATMEDGRTVEVGPVGNEGLVGLRVFLGVETTPDRVIVHVAGDTQRLRATALKAELGRSNSALSRKVKRYTGMLLAMVSRSSACNKLHTLEQQFARWLLTMSDYVGNDLRLTHDLIALTLGVRRAGVTEAANSLRNKKVIDYRRNHIQVIDREKLQAITCECYQIIKEEYDALYADLSK